MESLAIKTLLETGLIDFGTMPKWEPISKEDASAMFVKTMEAVKSVAAGLSETDWDSEATMLGGKEPWKMARGHMALTLLPDFIHHRGQLSTYLRAMGGKVPSIYGPSADTPEM